MKQTFPSDEPKKRIDLILFREPQNGNGNGGDGLRVAKKKKLVTVIDTHLVGQDPSEDTKNDPGHGMLDRDSPLWASDHRGVVSTFQYNNKDL